MIISLDIKQSAVAAYQAGASIREAAAANGIAQVTLSRYMKLVGIPRRRVGRPTGLIKTPEQHQAEPRTKQMVRQRSLGWTYQQIGDEHGITRQRVEQILNAAGHEWATGWYANARPERTCPECDGTFKGQQIRHCSRECVSAFAARTLAPREAECMEIIMQVRSEGGTWIEATKACGWKINKHGTGLHHHFLRWCAKVGVDPTPYLGWNPPAARNKETTP